MSEGWGIKPALVLDLDGTIRYNAEDPEGFINGPDEIALYPDVEETLWEYRDRGYLILGATNQGGVAFGFKTIKGLNEEFEATSALFDRDPFHSIQCCPHHEKGKVAPYDHRSLFRKPDIGMLALLEVEAFDEGFVIDWDRSIFVGDRAEDQECARRAGIKFVHTDDFFERGTP